MLTWHPDGQDTHRAWLMGCAWVRVWRQADDWRADLSFLPGWVRLADAETAGEAQAAAAAWVTDQCRRMLAELEG